MTDSLQQTELHKVLREPSSIEALKALRLNEGVFFALVCLDKGMEGRNPRDLVLSMSRSACGNFGKDLKAGGNDWFSWVISVPNDPGPLSVWSVSRDPDRVCLFGGDLYENPTGLSLSAGEAPVLAKWVADRMAGTELEGIEELNGVFGCIYIDCLNRLVKVFGDNSGTHPVFWSHANGLFAVSNNMWAFRGLTGRRVELDEVSVAEYLTIGFPLKGRTWLKGIRQLQHRRLVTYSATSARIEIAARPSIWKRNECSFEEAKSFVRETLGSRLEDLSQRAGGPLGLGLSGGLDSRICLAALHSRKIDTRAFSFCHSQDLPDNRLARTLAQHVGIEHSTVLLHSPTALQLYRDLRLINEGESPGFGFFLLAAAVSGQVDTLILGSETIRDTPLGPYSVWKLKSRRDLAEGMLKGQMLPRTFSQMTTLLSPQFRIDPSVIEQEWYESFDVINEEDLLDVMLEHQTDYRVQRRTRPRLEAARWFCQPIYPYLDYHVNKAFRTIPARFLKGERFHLELLKSFGQGLERWPNAARSFTRFPAGWESTIAPIVQFTRVVNARVRQPLQNELRCLMGKLGLGRSALVPCLVEDLDRLKSSGIFDNEALTRLVSQARVGTYADREFLHALVSVGTIESFIDRKLEGSCSLRYLQDGFSPVKVGEVAAS